MAIKQLTVFVQNQKGTVASVTDSLSKTDINLRALSIAETQDFGILRLIVNDVLYCGERVYRLYRRAEKHTLILYRIRLVSNVKSLLDRAVEKGAEHRQGRHRRIISPVDRLTV